MLRCRIRLAESVDAAARRHHAAREQHAILAKLYPEPTPSLVRATIAKATLRSWCKRLRRDIRNQRKAIKLLAETSKVFSGIADDTSELRARFIGRAETWQNCIATFPPSPNCKGAFSRDSASDVRSTCPDKRYIRLCDAQDHHPLQSLRDAWMRAAQKVSTAMDSSVYLSQLIRREGDDKIKSRLGARAHKDSFVKELCGVGDILKAEAMADAGEEAEKMLKKVESWRHRLVAFLGCCEEELLSASATIAELTDSVFQTRLAFLVKEFGDPSKLTSCKGREKLVSHRCYEEQCRLDYAKAINVAEFDALLANPVHLDSMSPQEGTLLGGPRPSSHAVTA